MKPEAALQALPLLQRYCPKLGALPIEQIAKALDWNRVYEWQLQVKPGDYVLSMGVVDGDPDVNVWAVCETDPKVLADVLDDSDQEPDAGLWRCVKDAALPDAEPLAMPVYSFRYKLSAEQFQALQSAGFPSTIHDALLVLTGAVSLSPAPSRN